jgi:hypothetical protein
MRAAHTVVIELAALALLTAAASIVALPLGLAAAGVALLVVAWGLSR